MNFKKLLLIMMSTAALMGCSKVQVSDLSSDKAGTNGINGDGTGGGTGGDGTGGGSGDNTPHLTTATLKPASQKVDLLLVLDDSTSMKPDSLALGRKLDGFLNQLEAYSLDWQLCMTTTNYNDDRGVSLTFQGVNRAEPWIIKKGDTNVSDKVVATIDNHTFGGGETGDERGIASMSAHLSYSSSNHCYRSGAALSVILISDEDERSTGGLSLGTSSPRPIETIDQPENYISQVQRQLGNSVALTVQSLIVLPNDQTCLAEQNNQGYPGYVGYFYHKLSGLTGGSAGSICSSDYSQSLSVFAGQIQKSFQRVKLDCVPAAGWKISTSPVIQNVQAHVENDFLVIESQVTQDTTVNVQYTCK